LLLDACVSNAAVLLAPLLLPLDRRT
jgi:hypothetical protein